MTIKFSQKIFKCSGCKAEFIPFDKEHKCPQCHKKVNKCIHEFIPMVKYTMLCNKKIYGKYLPGSYGIYSLMDYIQTTIFNIFDLAEAKKIKNRERFIDRYFENKFWKKRKYLKAHVRDIAHKISNELELNNNKGQNQWENN